MLGRAFLLASALFLGLLAFAFWSDANRDYVPIQQKYLGQYGGSFPIQIQQLFPKVQVNGNFQIERCITCHVPDIQKIGPEQAAQRLGGGHPVRIDDQVFAKYGQDTLMCRTLPAAAASASPPASTSASAKASPSAAASPSASATPSGPPSAKNPKTAAGALTGGSTAPAPATVSCQDPSATPYYLLDATGHQVTDQAGKPVVAALTGFIPRQFKGLGIDESGCIVCHNGNRQGTTVNGAHQNLVPNPFAVYDTAPTLYENSCAQCHGALGEGGKGPPLNDQDRLGFFQDDYYQRCIYAGNRGSEHLNTIMPAWGLQHILSNSRITLLVHWIRLWQDYARLP